MAKKKSRRADSTQSGLRQMLAIAMQHHQSGQLPQAKQAYQQLLRQYPNQIDAIHFLGVIALQTGDFDQAIAHCQHALTLKPDLLHAHIHLAHALRAKGQRTEAIGHYQQAISLNPTLAEVHLNLGTTYHELGQRTEAIAHYQQSLKYQPKLAIAHYNWGRVLQETGQPQEALPHYQQALQLEPGYAEAQTHLASVLMELGHWQEAIAHYQKALTLQPQMAGIYVNLGKATEALGDLDTAATYYQTALTLDPTLAIVHNNLGDLRRDQNRMADAIAHYQQAIALNPDLAEAHSNLGMALLRVGELQRGWAEFEWRWRCAPLLSAPFPQPQWDGSNLVGKTIPLHSPSAEQGFGDTIQFIRYVPLLQKQGGRVIVECLPPLVRLFAAIPDLVVVPKGEPLPAFDVHTSLMSLPYCFGTDLDTIPPAPYLNPPATSSLSLTGRSPDDLKVGLVWGGKPLFKGERRRDRTCPLHHFAPILDIPGYSFLSLQKDHHASEIQTLGWGDKIQDLSPQLKDFADTAAAIAQLDLVISIDTAVAHLAGALGQTVWVLLPYASEWRWLCDRDDSPWYPTIRLFRQPSPGDWDAVINQVIAG